MDLKKQIKIALGLETEEEVKLGFQAKTEDGTIIVSESDTLEVGVDISVLTEDGTTIKLPVGLYVMEDGTKVKVEEEGIVAEIMEGEAEETEEEVEEVEASEEEELKHKPNHKYEEIEERMTKLEKLRLKELLPIMEEARQKQFQRDLVSGQMQMAGQLLGNIYPR